MQGPMERQPDSLRNLRASPAHRMDRHLYAYVKQRLNRPEALDALAHAICERIAHIPARQLVRSPLRRFLVTAARTLRELQAGAPDTHTAHHPVSSTRHDGELTQHLQQALTQLPATHATVLIAHKRDHLSFSEIAEKFGLPPALVATYCAQARALIRSAPHDPS